MALLEVQSVDKVFGGLKALNNVSMKAEKGEISALIGPNGAGKTTLFNVITGFYTPTSGTILFEGEHIEGLPSYKLISKGISRTFQNIHLIQEMTALENVQLGHHHILKETLLDSMVFSKRYRRDEKYSREDAEQCLAFVGLDQYKNELVKNLPYGVQKKLEIARTLASGAELLLFDEPCAGLNTAEKAQLEVLVTDINTKLKKTIVLIEHDMRFVMNLSEHITVLARGELLAVGTPKEIQTNPAVMEAYLGSARSRRLDDAEN